MEPGVGHVARTVRVSYKAISRGKIDLGRLAGYGKWRTLVWISVELPVLRHQIAFGPNHRVMRLPYVYVAVAGRGEQVDRTAYFPAAGYLDVYAFGPKPRAIRNHPVARNICGIVFHGFNGAVGQVVHELIYVPGRCEILPCLERGNRLAKPSLGSVCRRGVGHGREIGRQRCLYNYGIVDRPHGVGCVVSRNDAPDCIGIRVCINASCQVGSSMDENAVHVGYGTADESNVVRIERGQCCFGFRYRCLPRDESGAER